jgi:hypothetical protein
MDEDAERDFNARMRLAQFGADQWERRRAYEWRLSLALWALLAGAVAIKDRFDISQATALLVSAAILAFYVWFWLKPVYATNKLDRDLIRVHLSKAQELVGQAPTPPKQRSFWGDWSTLFQAAVTAILLLVFCAVELRPGS